MLIEAYHPQRHFETHAKSIVAFKKLHKGAVIEAVNDRPVIGMCESCGDPLFEGDKYNHDSEGVRWHRGKCPPLLRGEVKRKRTKRKR